MEKTTYIITGSAGYFATNFIKLLHSKGVLPSEIIKIDKEYGEEFDLTSISFYPFFCTSSHILGGGCVKIINFAADSFVPDSITNPEEVIKNNVGCLETVIELNKFLIKKGFNSEIIHISTDEVHTQNPTPSAYVISKRKCEELCEQHKIKFMRPVNLVGNYQTQKHDCLMKLIHLQPDKVKIHGSGQQRRMFMNVKTASELLYGFANSVFKRCLDITRPEFEKYRTQDLRIKDVITHFIPDCEEIDDPREQYQDITYSQYSNSTNEPAINDWLILSQK